MHREQETRNALEGRLDERTVVITGAASGIGKAAAIEFARERWNVVAVARGEKGLNELVPECELLGATVLMQISDVTDQIGMNTVAANAVDSFGRIDAWVNNAGVLLYGKFGEVPHEVFRKVVETNFFGCIHGARAVLPYFREQGQGTLINIASFAGLTGMPYSTAYAASKAAVGVFSDCLRMELRHEPGIHVCTVYPPSIDTPLFRHAANYFGCAPRPIKPVYKAEKVAREIVKLARRPRREVIVGSAGKGAYLMHLLAPSLTEKAMARMGTMAGFLDREAPITDGNLYQPDEEETAISGGWTDAQGGRHVIRSLVGLGALVPGIGAVSWFIRRMYLRSV